MWAAETDFLPLGTFVRFPTLETWTRSFSPLLILEGLLRFFSLLLASRVLSIRACFHSLILGPFSRLDTGVELRNDFRGNGETWRIRGPSNQSTSSQLTPCDAPPFPLETTRSWRFLPLDGLWQVVLTTDELLVP
ncbi:hypothetical protein N7468_000191 [Penicillium chermesinum]|uniref:Uncharacterized protein n=1 Tax=Penicillium chermesinum TaxID=63820 RepID=A0A9W9PLU6_9EURO|nr:uncharacterized protein N7468_000191 [Penicillium chermesinum]KAJ5248740.1 hypothetical protein N7468_000191 [Penicillium chermesinum]